MYSKSIADQALCTSGVIYGQNEADHHVYMGKPKKRRSFKPRVLRWRPTRIGLWRNRAKLTQQAVADALGARGIMLDRVSIVRIEGGKQMPTIEALEAMAALFKIDVDLMLNYTPEQAVDLAQFKRMGAKDQQRALRMVRAAQEDQA